MRTGIELTHKGRHLAIRAAMIAGDWQIWFHENGHRIYLYAVLAGDQHAALDQTLQQARQDLEAETIILPVVRFWPAPPLPARPSSRDPQRASGERGPAPAESCARSGQAPR